MLVVLPAVLLAASCTGDPDPGPVPSPSSPPNAGAAATELPDSGRDAIVPLVAPMATDGLRWARGNVPRAVPEVTESLPSLLDDPPGRAVVASYVPRTDGLGWPGEAVEFYGIDGRWRRLALGDLDLPADGWAGYDTYGAGALSPDGRWWAGPMIGGMFVVDLEDGAARVLRAKDLGRHGMASFEWSPDSDELVLILSGRRARVSVPDLVRTPFPRPRAYSLLHADGSYTECPVVRRVVSECVTYDRTDQQVETRPFPADLQTRWVLPMGWRGDTVWVSAPKNSSGNQRADWEVLRTDSGFAASARLVLPRRSDIDSVGPAYDGSRLQLAALDERLLLAWLADEGEIVRLLRTGPLMAGSHDYWDVSLARDLVRIR